MQNMFEWNYWLRPTKHFVTSLPQKTYLYPLYSKVCSNFCLHELHLVDTVFRYLCDFDVWLCGQRRWSFLLLQPRRLLLQAASMVPGAMLTWLEKRLALVALVPCQTWQISWFVHGLDHWLTWLVTGLVSWLLGDLSWLMSWQSSLLMENFFKENLHKEPQVRHSYRFYMFFSFETSAPRLCRRLC